MERRSTFVPGKRFSWHRRRAAVGWLALLSLLLVALTACGGSVATTTRRLATSVAAATPSARSSASGSSAAAGGSSAAASGASSASGSAKASASGSASAQGSAASSGGGAHFTMAQDGNSKATYNVKETFVGRGVSTAVGTTTAVTGGLTINTAKPSASTIDKITFDISKLKSDSGQRDDQIRQRWLESNKYPTATFVTKRLEGLPDTAYTDGQTLTFKIVGDLTIRTVTKEITFETTGKIANNVFTGTAKTQFNMTDFGFDPPSVAGVLTAENGVVLELTIQAKKD